MSQSLQGHGLYDLGCVPAPWPTGHHPCTPGVSCPQGPRGIRLHPSGGLIVPILLGVSHPHDPRDIIPVPHGVSLSPPGYPRLPPNPKVSHPHGPWGHCACPPGGCPCCPGGCAVPIAPGILFLFPQECPTAPRIPLFPPECPCPPGVSHTQGPRDCPPSLPPGLSYPVRGVPVLTGVPSPVQNLSPAPRDHGARSGGGTRAGAGLCSCGRDQGRSSGQWRVAPSVGPTAPPNVTSASARAGSTVTLAAMASRLLRVSAALRLLPAASARTMPARHLGVPGERGPGKRGNGEGGAGKERAGPGEDGAGFLHPRVTAPRREPGQ